jgi:hypothetical protein
VYPNKIEAMQDWPLPKTPKFVCISGFNELLSQVC